MCIRDRHDTFLYPWHLNWCFSINVIMTLNKLKWSIFCARSSNTSIRLDIFCWKIGQIFENFRRKLCTATTALLLYLGVDNYSQSRWKRKLLYLVPAFRNPLSAEEHRGDPVTSLRGKPITELSNLAFLPLTDAIILMMTYHGTEIIKTNSVSNIFEIVRFLYQYHAGSFSLPVHVYI